MGSKLKDSLHNLVLGQASGSLGVHRVAVALIGVPDIRQTKRTTSILISSEFGCGVLARHNMNEWEDVQIAVSASSGSSNSTTPLPRERPLGSY
jgi:hypothetical protein